MENESWKAYTAKPTDDNGDLSTISIKFSGWRQEKCNYCAFMV